jgi:hypothetical protein
VQIFSRSVKLDEIALFGELTGSAWGSFDERDFALGKESVDERRAQGRGRRSAVRVCEGARVEG